MKTRRTIKGTSAEGVVEEAYTPSNPPPYPVVANGSYLTLGAGYLATQIKITATSSALVGWHKFAEISYGTASTNYSYSAILLINGVHSTQLSAHTNTSESGEIEIDFYKEVASNPTQIGILVLSGNINANEICAVLDSANSKISLYSYFNLYQSVSYSLISEEQGLSSKPAKVVFVSEYYGTTVPTSAIYAVVRNNASYANTASYAATASYADTAGTLTEPFTVGVDTTTATTGYVKFASVSLPASYRSATARFEMLDKNPLNAQTQMCGLELMVKNINTTNVQIVPRLLYGSSDRLGRIYACAKTGTYPVTVDLYYDITSTNPQETISCIKPLFTFGRTTLNVEFTFIADNELVSALPTDTTNTQLSTVCVLVTEAVQATKATQDANGNVIDTTYATKTEVNAKYTKPASGIPETDLSADVQAKLNAGGGSNTKTWISSTQKSMYPYKWEPKTWNGLTSFGGEHIWTDGENIYRSTRGAGAIQFVLNRETSTWKSKTWNGLTSFSGAGIWTDGENIYYSYSADQYVLNRETSTWEPKTWNGLTSFIGNCVWTDGENIYYSNIEAGAIQFVLNRETSTWEPKTWNGLTSFFGNYVWTDGENIYYSYSADQYVLNRETSTWEPKTWNGLTSFGGVNVWTDGENIYYSIRETQFVLNRETWEPKTWNGLTSFFGNYVWTDGENIYYSNSADQYKLAKAISTTKTTLQR